MNYLKILNEDEQIQEERSYALNSYNMFSGYLTGKFDPPSMNINNIQYKKPHLPPGWKTFDLEGYSKHVMSLTNYSSNGKGRLIKKGNGFYEIEWDMKDGSYTYTKVDKDGNIVGIAYKDKGD